MCTKRLWAFLVLVLASFAVLSPNEGDSADIVFSLNSQSSISFTSSQSSFQLTLPNYQTGTVSPAVTVEYQVMANDVGRLEDLVLARLLTALDGVSLESRMDQFSKTSGTAHLVSNASGYTTLEAQDVGLADKVIDEGDGRIIDGSLTVSYRARAVRALEAGVHETTVIVSFADN